MSLRNMKNGKATGPDNLPVEVWNSLGTAGVKEALNKITDEENIPDIWRKILMPIFKNKGDNMNGGNYRGIKLVFLTFRRLLSIWGSGWCRDLSIFLGKWPIPP